jgi:hypothetical protein
VPGVVVGAFGARPHLYGHMRQAAQSSQPLVIGLRRGRMVGGDDGYDGMMPGTEAPKVQVDQVFAL